MKAARPIAVLGTRERTTSFDDRYRRSMIQRQDEEDRMGAWAEDTFGNDTACDWVGTFLSDPGLEAIQNAIGSVLAADDYLDSDEACECLAACEVLARLQGNWGLRNAYSEELDDWVEANPGTVPTELINSAISAIDRVLGSNSELQELWDEDGPNEDWHNAVNDLRDRVGG